MRTFDIGLSQACHRYMAYGRRGIGRPLGTFEARLLNSSATPAGGLRSPSRTIDQRRAPRRCRAQGRLAELTVNCAARLFLAGHVEEVNAGMPNMRCCSTAGCAASRRSVPNERQASDPGRCSSAADPDRALTAAHRYPFSLESSRRRLPIHDHPVIHRVESSSSRVPGSTISRHRGRMTCSGCAPA